MKILLLVLSFWFTSQGAYCATRKPSKTPISKKVKPAKAKSAASSTRPVAKQLSSPSPQDAYKTKVAEIILTVYPYLSVVEQEMSTLKNAIATEGQEFITWKVLQPDHTDWSNTSEAERSASALNDVMVWNQTDKAKALQKAIHDAESTLVKRVTELSPKIAKVRAISSIPKSMAEVDHYLVEFSFEAERYLLVVAEYVKTPIEDNESSAAARLLKARNYYRLAIEEFQRRTDQKVKQKTYVDG